MPVYNIGICDDDKNMCCELESMLIDIFREFNVHVEIEPWYSGETLCKHLEMGNAFDLLFLDIELLTLNGVEVGKFIRESLNDIKTKIIFISYHKGYAMQLFSVQPLDFIEKPLEYDAVKKAVGIFLKIEGLGKIFLEYRNGNVFCREWCENIIYITSDNRILW